MAPGRKRGAKGLKAKSELSLGDLVLAKVKGFPAWPAKIGRPEDWERAPDPKKYFVQFFGTSEIAFVAPADIQSFTNEAKNKLSARCLGKTVKYFAQAVKEICDEFEGLQQKNVSGVGDDNSAQQTHSSEVHPVDPAVDEALDVSQDNGILLECKLETKDSVEVGSGLEHCPHKQDEVESNDGKHYLSGDVNSRLSPPVSSRKRKKLSPNDSNLVKDSLPVSSPRKKLSPNDSNLVKDSLPVSSPSHHYLKKEDHLDIKVKGNQNELTNGDRPKLAMESKKESQAAVIRSGGSVVRRDHSAEIMRRKLAAGGIMKLSSPDSKLHIDLSNKKREKRLVKEERLSEAPDNGQEDAKVKLESRIDSISQKKLKVQHGHEKQGAQMNEASFPTKTLKSAGTAKNPNLIKAQIKCKSDSRSTNVLDAKMASKELKRLTPVGKALPVRLPIVNITESNHLSDEDDCPPVKRLRQESEAMSGSDLISENRLGTSVSHETDLVVPSKHRSPVVQLPMKRRSVRLCDDDVDDELPKTPIHGGPTSKVSVTQRNKSVKRCEGYAHDPKVSGNSGRVDNGLKEQEQSGGGMNKVLPPAAKQGMEKRTREPPAAHLSPSSRQLDSENLAPMNSEKSVPVKVVPVSVSPRTSPQYIGGARLLGELQCKQPNKAPGSDFGRKSPAGDIKKSASSDRLNLKSSQTLSERSNQPSSVEKKKSAAKSDPRINDSAAGCSNENIVPVRERLNASKDKNITYVVDSKTSDSVLSMRHLIAAAQARKKQTHLQNTYGNPFLFSFPDIDMTGRGPSPPPAALAHEASKTVQLDPLGSYPASPCSNVQQVPSNNQHENDELEERRVSSGHQGTGSSLSGGTEAAVARDAFEGMIETLSRTKESIARATRLAIDCAKFGLANEVVELLIQKLENEPSLHRRVDLFFLVDSITQCSHTQKGASYVYTVQAALPRLIGAAAPAGAGAQENRRQCRKVLRLWLERKILPESVLRRYMDDLGVVNDTAISLRRPSRAERSIDDPIREMEGMVVDEYGSNAMIQLPGLLLANVFEEEDDDEGAADTNLCMRNDDKSPYKHTPITDREPENCSATPSDRRHCILEEVDGELEMEDVSGHHKDERPLMHDGSVDLASSELNQVPKSSSNISNECLPSPEGSPPLPPGSPPPTPPLPTSPPPSSPPPPPPPMSSPPPPPPPPPPTTQQHPFPQPPVGPPQPPVGPPSHVGPTPPVGPLPPPFRPPPPLGPHHPPFGPPPHLGHPMPLTTQQSFPSQPPLVSQNKTPLPPLPHPLPHEVGTTHAANQQNVMSSTSHGSHIHTSVRGEVLPQQSSHFPPGASIAREHGGYNSSRHAEYGEDDAYMNPQASQLRQQYLPGSVPFPQRGGHPELPAQCPPNHFPYPNSAHQHQNHSYSIPKFSDGQRRYAPDEQWLKQGNEFNANHPHGGWTPGGRSYSLEGYHERPPASAIAFQHSAPNPLPSSGQIPAHGVPVMASRPNMSAVNWRPA